jgi:transcriptional regulator with XRE-family HTH domain
MMSLAERIRRYRYTKGWGPSELATRARVSRTALFHIERGETLWPRAATLQRIARALGVTIADLLEECDEPAASASAEGNARAVPASAQEPGAAPAPATEPRPADGEWEVAWDRELERKVRNLIASPLGHWLAGVVDRAYEVLPILDRAATGGDLLADLERRRGRQDPGEDRGPRPGRPPSKRKRPRSAKGRSSP